MTGINWDAQIRAVGTYMAIPAAYLERYDPLLNTTRGICSLVEFAKKMPKYVPMILDKLPINLSTYVNADTFKFTLALTPVLHTFTQFRDQLQFLEAINRLARLKDWTPDLNWVKKAALACQAVQGVITFAVLHPTKEKWFNVCAFLSYACGHRINLSFDRVDAYKNFVVAGASSFGMWQGFKDMRTKNQTAMEKAGKLAYLNGIMTAPNPAQLLAQIPQPRKAKDAVGVLEQRLQAASTALNVAWIGLNNAPNYQRQLKIVKECTIEFNKQEDKFIRRVLVESFIQNVNPLALLTNICPGQTQAKIVSIGAQPIATLLNRIITHKRDKTAAQLQNARNGYQKARIGNIFESSKLLLLGLSIWREFRGATEGRDCLFWANLAVIGSLTFWRVTFNMNHEDRPMPKTEGLFA